MKQSKASLLYRYKIVKLVLCGSFQLYVTLKVLPTICLVMLLLSGDHTSCGSYQQYVLLRCCYLETMLHAGHVSSTSCNVVVSKPCFVWLMPTVRFVMLLLSGDHALCWVFTAVHLIMLHRTILNEGLASSMSYNVFAICRSCFVWVVPTVCLVMLLSGGHASCSSCLQYVLQCCCCLETMFSAGHASSTSCNVRNMLRGDLTRCMSCNVVAVCRPCFVQVVPVVCLIILMLSGDHASGGSCQRYVL